MKLNTPDKHDRYPAIGRCIYCNLVDKPLQDEHIIPEGFGTTLVLPDASCEKCAGVTSDIERVILREMFPVERATLGMYGNRRKKSRPTKFPVYVGKETNYAVRELGAELYPLHLMLPLLAKPAILDGVSDDVPLPDLTLPGKFWVWDNPQSAKQLEQLREEIPGQDISVRVKHDFIIFCRFLAKIAHAHATAVLGYGAFEPLLLPIILANRESVPPFIGTFIGGAHHGELPVVQLDHKTAFALAFHDYVNDYGEQLLAVNIQLFAVLGAPIYTVIAGKRVVKLT